MSTRPTPTVASGLERPNGRDSSAVQDTNFSGTDRTQYGSVETNATQPTTGSSRILAPDLLRGLLMALMSLDHGALFLGAWRHGTPKITESDSTVFTEWNHLAAWISRTLTHLCAPGFFFLMGMGTVYFTRSRVNLGWNRKRLMRHFVVRGVALAAVNESLGLILMAGRGFWLLNIVLLGLAIDYVISGMICLLLNESSKFVAGSLEKLLDSKTNEEQQSLLHEQRVNESQSNRGVSKSAQRAETLSFWIHNLVLLVLTGVTIFWNVWLSPHHGHCSPASFSPQSITVASVEHTVLSPYTANTAAPTPSRPPTNGSSHSVWFNFWFYSVQTTHIMSGFPPLAWISFCIFGVLYARVMLFCKWSPRAVVAGNAATAVVLSLLFVATRLFHFGNLSEGCLRMPEHIAHPLKNQYLASVQSFFYVTKYPPSPSFFFMTMAANFFLLAGFGALPPAAAMKIPGLMNFGGSALFFYVAHMAFYKFESIPVRYFFEHDLPDKSPNDWEKSRGVGDTPVFWIFWLLGLVVLSPMCRAYGKFKSSKSADSLWRFF